MLGRLGALLFFLQLSGTVGQTCSNTCNWASDGDCDDGGPGAQYAACSLGTDCVDCGSRSSSHPSVTCNDAHSLSHPNRQPCCTTRPSSHPYCSISCYYNSGQTCTGGCAIGLCTCRGEAVCYAYATIPCPSSPSHSHTPHSHTPHSHLPGSGATGCADGVDSGLFWTDGTVGSVPCSYCRSDPSDCCEYRVAQANCPATCGTCPPRHLICVNTCRNTYRDTGLIDGLTDNGECNDGGPGSEFCTISGECCPIGTDCNDCSAGVAAAAAATAAALACCGRPRRRRVSNRAPSPPPPAHSHHPHTPHSHTPHSHTPHSHTPHIHYPPPPP